MIERAIAVTTHGRFLVQAPSSAGPWPLLVGFHGYGEAAEDELERLRAIPGSGAWLLVAVQGLHRFYRRNHEVVASWMTRQGRDLAIADNVAYVAAVIDAASRDWKTDGRIVLAGFSQGVSMAFRAAAAKKAAGVIAVGGDVPPELDSDALARIQAVLIARGGRDEWYAQPAFESDIERLRAAGTDVDAVALEAGHEWNDDFGAAAGRFLGRWR